MKPVATKGNEIPFHTNPKALVRQGVSPGLCGSAMALLATPIKVREAGKTQASGSQERQKQSRFAPRALISPYVNWSMLLDWIPFSFLTSETASCWLPPSASRGSCWTRHSSGNTLVITPVSKAGFQPHSNSRFAA